MPNLIESIGYSLGKIHVGMIAYLCDLYRSGRHSPLSALLDALGAPVPSHPRPQREYRIGPGLRSDLAIFDRDSAYPCIVMETKVDDYESAKHGVWQTTLYSDATPQTPCRLYVTLGHGEFYHAPYDGRFAWVRLHRFCQAVKEAASLSPTTDFLSDWHAALQNELSRRDMVKCNQRDRLDGFRSGNWNIIFLGQLKEVFLARTEAQINDRQMPCGKSGLIVDPTCYTHGTKPDTILNFGWEREPIYAEINSNGRLNVKVVLGTEDDPDRQQRYEEARADISRILNCDVTKINAYWPQANTMTLISLDIDLVVEKGLLRFSENLDRTAGRLIGYLDALYADPSAVQAVNVPTAPETFLLAQQE